MEFISPGRNTKILGILSNRSRHAYLVAQSYLTLCGLMNSSLLGSSVHRISQAIILALVAISFFRGPSWPGIEPLSLALHADYLPPETPRKPLVRSACCVLSCFSHVWLFATLWTTACQAPLSMGFSRQEYWSELPFSPSRNLPNQGIKPVSLMSPELTGKLFTKSHWEALWNHRAVYKSRLLLRTLLAAEADTHPGTPALHMAPKPHMCERWIPAPWGNVWLALTGRIGEHCRRRFSRGEDMHPDQPLNRRGHSKSLRAEDTMVTLSIKVN